MDRQPLLQTLLSSISGVKKAYFEEPTANMMEYPCIIYKLDRRESLHANNAPYQKSKRYQVTVIDDDGLSPISDSVSDLPKCSHERRFVASGLYHDVFNLYF